MNFLFLHSPAPPGMRRERKSGVKLKMGKQERWVEDLLIIDFYFPLPCSGQITNNLIWFPQGESVFLVVVNAGWSLSALILIQEPFHIFSPLHSWGGHWQNSFGGTCHPTRVNPQHTPKISTNCHVSGTEKWFRKLRCGNGMAVQQGNCQVLFHLLPVSLIEQNLYF